MTGFICMKLAEANRNKYQFSKNLGRLRNFIYKSSIEDKYENIKGIVAIVVIM